MQTLVTITGRPRTGKDTLLNYVKVRRPDAVVLSSIDEIRGFVAGIKRGFGHPEKFMDIDRQVLAEIKAVLDESYGYTVNVAHRELLKRNTPILLYQVREPRNLARLREMCAAIGVRMFAAYVDRSDRPDVLGATTDLVGPSDFPFDWVVDTTPVRWEALVEELLHRITGPAS